MKILPNDFTGLINTECLQSHSDRDEYLSTFFNKTILTSDKVQHAGESRAEREQKAVDLCFGQISSFRNSPRVPFEIIWK